MINPNNPTGDYLNITEMKQYILDNCSSNSHVVIDESMQPWHSKNWRADSLISQTEWIEKIANEKSIFIYILHSWTKFFSCTGLRYGSLICPTKETYNKVQSILNIDDYFQFVITATESKRPKPSPVPYLEAMESLCLDPKETLIIEDSKTGLISAVNSGAHVVGLKTSLSSGQMQCISKKIYAINHFRELAL